MRSYYHPVIIAGILLPIIVSMVIELSPISRKIRYEYELINNASEMGRYKAVSLHYQEIMQRQPWRENLFEPLGEAEYLTGEEDLAAIWFEKADKKGYLSTHGKVIYAGLLAKKGNMDQAYDAWNSALRSGYGGSPPFDLILNAWKKNESSVPGDLLHTSLESHPDNAELWFDAGLDCVINDQTGCPEFFSRAEVLNSTYSGFKELVESGNDIVIDLVMMLIESNQLDIARVILERSTAGMANNIDEPDMLAALAYLTAINGGNGDQLIKEAITRAPASPRVMFFAAKLHEVQDEYGMALVFWHQLADSDPENPSWQIALARCMEELGEIPGALFYYQYATELGKNDVRTWMELAEFCLRFPDYLDAVGFPAVRNAIQLSPKDPKPVDLLGQMLLSQGDEISAERFFQSALQIEVDYPPAYLHLGMAAFNRNQFERAVEYFSTASRQQSDPFIRSQAIDWLSKIP
jgi:tetratricopeptide (TPR) repeat protein